MATLELKSVMTIDPHPNKTAVTPDSPASGTSVQTVQDVRTGNPLGPVLWLLAIAAWLIALLAPQFLAAYWPLAASNRLVMVGTIIGLVVLGILLILPTYTGKQLVNLFREAPTELRRITWPTKSDTLSSTWITLILLAILSLILYAMDQFFAMLVGWFIAR